MSKIIAGDGRQAGRRIQHFREAKRLDWILPLEISSIYLSDIFGGAAAPPYRRWVGRCCRNAQISNIFG
jgi:hypothetical protein